MRQTPHFPFYNNANGWNDAAKSDTVMEWLDWGINFNEKLLEFNELNYRISSPYPLQPYGHYQNYYIPSSPYQSSPALPNISNTTTAPPHANFQGSSALPKDHNSIASVTQSIEKKVRNQIEPSDHIVLTTLVCEKCLTVDFIPKRVNKDKSLTDTRTHTCRQDRLVEVEQGVKHDLKDFSTILRERLPIHFAARILKYSTSKKIYLRFMKLGSRPSESIGNMKLELPI